MTWHFAASGTELSVWNHTQDPTSDAPHQTLTADNGWTWAGDFPDDVLAVMHDDAMAAVGNQDYQRAIAVVLDMAGEQIKHVQ